MNVAILGLGIVGRGVYDIIKANYPQIAVSYILELDDSKCIGIRETVTKDYNDILNDSTVDVVIELIGGVDLPFKLISKALQHKKHVVTANKACISRHFKELHEIANDNNVCLRYEAAVGGGIIVLNPLKEMAKISTIDSIQGIFNGSTNFVLSNVFHNDMKISDAISLATKKGYLEADPAEDMDGFDLMRKVNILSSISYHQSFLESDCHRVPLSNVSPSLIQYIKKQKYILKYIGSSIKKDNEVMLRIEPVIFWNNHLYSHINYETNIIRITGDNVDNHSWIGPGAGRYPTGQAVVYDLNELLRGNKSNSSFEENNLVVNNDLITFRYLLELKTGEYVITKHISNIELNKKLGNVNSFVKISNDIDESIKMEVSYA